MIGSPLPATMYLIFTPLESKNWSAASALQGSRKSKLEITTRVVRFMSAPARRDELYRLNSFLFAQQCFVESAMKRTDQVRLQIRYCYAMILLSLACSGDRTKYSFPYLSR